MGRVVAGAAYVLIRAKDETGKVLSQVNKKIAAMGKQLNAVGSGMESAGLRLGLAATGLGRSMYIGIREAQKYQDAMLATQAILGVTTKEMEPLEKKVRNLGRTTSYTAEEVALGAEELARAFGPGSLQIIEDALDDVINLARAGQITMSESAMYMARSLMAFEIPATEAARVADALFVASSAGTTTVQELGSALSFVAGSAHDMGMSLEETVVTLAIFSNNMLTGTKGGTSLNNLLIEMTKNADKVKELFGFEMFKAGEARPMIEVFNDLRAGMKEMSQQERLTVLNDLFNIRGSRAAQALKNMDRVEEVLGLLAKGEITAAEAAQMMDSGLGGSIRRLITAFNSLAVTFGLSFEKMFQTLEDRFVPILNGLEAWFKENTHLAKNLAIAFLGIMGVAGGLIVLGATLKIFGLALVAISAIASTILFLFGPLVAVGAVLGEIAGIVYLLAKNFDIANEAVQAISQPIMDTFENIKSVVGSAFTAIKDRILAGDIKGAMNVLMVSLEQILQLGIIGMKKIWLEFTFFFQKLWIEVSAGIKKIWMDTVSSIAKSMLEMAGKNKFFNAVFKKISGVDVQAENERAKALGNESNLATNQIDQMNQQGTDKLAQDQNKALADLEAETKKLREGYAEQEKNAMGAVNQAIEMSKLPDRIAEEVQSNVKPYNYSETAGGPGPLRSLAATKMPEGLEMGSTEAAKAAFDNRKATLDAAQKTASNTAKIAEGITMLLKKGGTFVFEGVGSSFTTSPGG